MARIGRGYVNPTVRRSLQTSETFVGLVTSATAAAGNTTIIGKVTGTAATTTASAGNANVVGTVTGVAAAATAAAGPSTVIWSCAVTTSTATAGTSSNTDRLLLAVLAATLTGSSGNPSTNLPTAFIGTKGTATASGGSHTVKWKVAPIGAGALAPVVTGHRVPRFETVFVALPPPAKELRWTNPRRHTMTGEHAGVLNEIFDDLESWLQENA